MLQSRRTLLRRGLLLGSVGLTGCVAEQDEGAPSSTDDTSTEDEMPTEIKFWLQEVSLSESEQDAIDPIVYSELSSGQQEIVQTALQEGKYITEMREAPPELSGLRRAIEAQAGDGVEAYLKQKDTYYRVGFVSGDHIIASS